jgi:hypothetical protein
MRRRPRVLLLVSVIAAIGVAGSAQAAGQSTAYQVEVSLNCTSAKSCTVAQLPNGAAFGTWLSLQLEQGGGGTYTGADCASNFHGKTGTFPVSGDLTWKSVTTYDPSAMANVDLIKITGVKLVDGTTSVTLTVPDATGQKDSDASQVFQVASSSIGVQGFSGTVQLQITQ